MESSPTVLEASSNVRITGARPLQWRQAMADGGGMGENWKYLLAACGIF
jgi:hypothetical protein